MADKLYVIVRRDIPAGPQAVQAVHAARQFQHEHPELEGSWFSASNHLALLSVRDEAELERLCQKARDRGLAFSTFREPDLGNSLTAVALEPGDRGRRLCSGMRLALAPCCPERDRLPA